MKRKDLKVNGYKLHHKAARRGYVSRKADIDELRATPYAGQYGEGYTVLCPRFDTSQYVWIEYWVKN